MINHRALIIAAFVLIFFCAVVVKLFTIQVSNKDYYTFIAKRQQNKPSVVKAERGMIKDTNGEILSFTRYNISFFIDTRMMNEQKIDSISKAFARIFEKNTSYYKNIIINGSRNVCLEKKVPMDKAIELKKIVIDGMFYEEDYTRVYPYGSLASHVLGYVNKQMEGVEGIEKSFDSKLTGKDGVYLFERDVTGQVISVDEKQSRAPEKGNDVILTINKTYQNILEQELNAGIEKYGAESGVGIIMNPNSGQILALSNHPDYDPANYELFSAEVRRNRTITDTYEPGSTIKSIILAALFDQKAVKENEIIDTENGRYFIRNAKITDSHPYPSLTVRQILEQSSNIGMAKLSTRISDDVLYKYLRDFGFNNPGSIELPGEANGFLKKPSGFSLLTKPFLSFGYEISVTPLQMITAFSALINGGIIYKPYIVKEIRNNKGDIIEETKPLKIRNVIDQTTSDILRNMMVGVVEKGTGTAAQLNNVLVGGKTGTSQKLEGGSYSSRKHNSSFIGFFPADNPQLICMIVYHSPKIGKYGGLVAAPVFKSVAERIIAADLTIAPDRKLIKRDKRLIDQLMVDIKTSNTTTSKSYLNVPEKQNINHQVKSFNGDKSVMPDLVKLTMRDAVALLNDIGVQYKIIGTGNVVEQSIEVGATITPGLVCWIKCEPMKKLNSVRIN